MPSNTHHRASWTARTCTWLSLLLSLEVSAAEHAPSFATHSAQYSPYFPSAPYQEPPPSCHVTQVNVLQRHGARYPTLGAALDMVSSLSKLQGRKSYPSELEFMRSYKYNLGVNSLLPAGALESRQAGKEVFERYCSRTRSDDCGEPFIRASLSERVVQSASNWSLAFSYEARSSPPPILTISERIGAKNPLENRCPNGPPSLKEQREWQDVFAPSIIARLETVDPPFGLDGLDIVNFAHLCAFESLALEATSPFCGLFREEDWEAIEYHGDLSKYFGFGHGNPLARGQGVGYVNELVARLTGDRTYIEQDTTQINHTLDSDSATFPLDRKIYVDFSHDNLIAPVVSLIGLFNDPPLNSTHPDPHRRWVFSEIAPFGGRLVVERLSCSAGEHVRILSSDAVQPLGSFCEGALANGLCRLSSFVKAMEMATAIGTEEYRRCF
ncbi:histidine phosphatase superfamily [Leucosporidium creatinivorum]|uniref:Phytase A n=1 Tax=Leucosporidium creatinivorum TaxID=106004 RepID=A0A1Y2DZV2_9BASI|nr:histidine phosphatase superfamily [Leucosporidium creatinivorum]